MERGQRELALKESEEKLRLLAELMPAGTFLTDRTGKCVYANPSWCEMTGLQMAEALGDGWKRSLHPEDRIRVIAAWERMIESPGKWGMEYRFVTPAGRVTWAHGIAAPHRSEQGEIVGFVGINSDITERKQAEAALQENQERFRSILDATPVPMALNDKSDRITFLNPAFTRTFGYEHRDIPTLGDWWPKAYPDPAYRRWVSEAWQTELRRSAQTGTAFKPMELRICCKDGTARVALVCASPLSGDRNDGHLVMLNDITERMRAEEELRKSEERFKLSMEATNDGLWDWDTKTDAGYFSPGYFRMLGYEPGEFVMAAGSWEALIHPADREFVLQANQNCIVGRCEQFAVEYRLRAKDGEWRWILGRGKCIGRDQQGRALRLVGTHVDITERKRAEERAQEREEALKEAQRVAHVGHWQWNALSDQIWWSDELYRIYRKDPRVPAATYEKDQNNYTAESAARLTTVVREALDSGQSYEVDLELNPDFRPGAWVTARGEAVRDANGRIVGLRGTVQDITERKLAEKALQNSVREKEALLKEVHHRVKNNLQVVTSLLRLDASRRLEPDAKAMLRDLQGRIRSMALLHESLYRTGIFAGVDLGAYLRDLAAQSFAAHVARQGTVRLRLDLASVSVEMDRAVPCGLLVNELLSNCLKHGFPDNRVGEVRLELRASVDGKPSMLRVSDTGVGLPANFEEKCETSLGLNLVADLAKQIDGRLEIGPGPGAMFTVEFMAKPARGPATTV